MIIKLDHREVEIINLCKYYLENLPLYKELQIVVEALPIGDIIITDELGGDRVIIERKSLNDLSASIKDGRYEEQSYRLNGLPHHNHNIIYLIEGDMNKLNIFKSRIDKTMLYSAMISLNYNKGFSVIRTLNIEETSLFICNMAYKIKKSEANNKKAYYSNKIINLKEEEKKNEEQGEKDISDDNIEIKDEEKEEAFTDKDYCSVIKKVKKENITRDNISEIMLSQMPGISTITALAIMNKFKNLANLITEIQKSEDCLKDISYTNSKGQVRKISKSVLKNIVLFLKP